MGKVAWGFTCSIDGYIAGPGHDMTWLSAAEPSDAGDPSIIALNCDIVEAVRRAQEIAGDRDVQIISADIARQALEHDLIDELQVFVAPVFLGDGIRIFDVPGGRRYDWELVEIHEGAKRSFGRTYRPKLR